MTKEEWREIIKEIYYQSIEPKLRRKIKKFHPFEICERYPYDIHRLIKALRTIRFIDETFDEEENLAESFTQEFLLKILNDVDSGLSLNNHLVLETGIVDAIEEFFEEIIDGMDVDDIPEQDFEALLKSGSRNPKAEIQFSMLKLRKKKDIIIKRGKNHSLYYRVKESKDIIKQRQAEIKESNSNISPRRKIFKGIGTICKGALLTTVDATLVAGLWPFSLSIETTTVGAVVSMTTGIGDIFNGIGEIRGE